MVGYESWEADKGQVTHSLVTHDKQFGEVMGASSKIMTWFDLYILNATGRRDYKESPPQIVPYVWKAFLWVLSRGQTPEAQNRARAGKLMNTPGTLLFFIFIYLESGIFLKLLHILSDVISSPSFSINPISLFPIFQKFTEVYQLMAIFLKYYL